MIGFRMGNGLGQALKVGHPPAKRKTAGMHRAALALPLPARYDRAKRSDSPWLAISKSPKARADISR
jgi:hypothetical protein